MSVRTVSSKPISSDKGRVLLANCTIRHFYSAWPVHSADENASWLQKKARALSRLRKNQQLRGCIGTLEAHRPLLLDVKANAQAAALRDPRFPR